MSRNFGLELNGALVGKLGAVAGGDIKVEVISEKMGSSPFAKKQVGNVQYTPIELSTGVGMGRAFYDWIDQSWRGEMPREDGALVIFDDKNKGLSRQEFRNALIVETTFPALDASLKDSASIRLKFQPEISRMQPAGSKPADVKLGVYATAGAKRWLAGNFRLSIDGLETACAKVTRIDALSVKFGIVRDTVGDARDSDIHRGALAFSNLKITLPETAATDLSTWFQDFVIKGNSSEANEKTGRLEYLTPDGKKAYFTIKFDNLGIIKVASDIGSGQRLVTAEMYCERMTLGYDTVATLG